MYLYFMILSAVYVSRTLCEDVKFEYEHQVLSRIVQLEQDHKVMKYVLTNYQQLEDTNRETARILESQETSLRQLEAGYKTISTENEKTADMLKDQETSLSQLETGYKTVSTENEKTTKTLAEYAAGLMQLEANYKTMSTENKETANALKVQTGQVKGLAENYRVCSADLANLKTELQTLKDKASNKGLGSAYTRWGRPECPGNGSELVYSGYIGGSYYNHKGAASNHLCLPNEPQYNKYVSGWQSTGRIFGAEYDMSSSETFFGKSLTSHEPPCAVCKSPRTSIVMIPARTTCYDGWSKEYGGYLVSGYYGHIAATEYICLDKDATITEWSKSVNNYGRMLYMVEGDCGHNLKCPPYENQKEFACVVCSK